MTVTFVIEAMAAANAVLKQRAAEKIRQVCYVFLWKARNLLVLHVYLIGLLAQQVRAYPGFRNLNTPSNL